MGSDNVIHNGVDFLKSMKEANIQSNAASIEVHRDIIVMSLEEAIQGEVSMQCPLIQKHINKLKAIDPKNMGLNIVEPMIGIAAQLEGVVGSPIDADISLVQGHIEEFKNALYSTLTISQKIKDTRINRHIFAATDIFTTKFLDKEAGK